MRWHSFAQALADAGVERPWRELRLLAEHVTGIPYIDVLLTAPCLSDEQWDVLKTLVERRIKREPLAKILGKASFWTHEFISTQDTLDPRPESELFVEAVLASRPDTSAPMTFLDIGTGTGCLLLSCLSEYTNATGVGVDISPLALDVAIRNSAKLGLLPRAHFQLSNWCQNVDQTFDVILCNPPYVAENDKVSPNGNLDPETLYDPPVALFAGRDGLAAYREIFATLRKNVYPNGGTHPPSTIFVEIGMGQHDVVCQIANQYGFVLTRSIFDYQKIPRILELNITK
ncbi:MAG: peptide chain release factor N(5)-glutamine methyltransferase [Holosporales bacterium]|jgi:release factor glutamine methyltransferase|nr:peptide chain release factor N(5)-glutamine methyltransferase [Holosporales bacterium]